jgi:hypothetical protein
MMKLLSATPSPYARKVRIALAEKGIPFELVTERCRGTPMPRHPATTRSRSSLSLPRLGGHLRKVGSASTGKERWRNGSGAGSRRSTRARR